MTCSEQQLIEFQAPRYLRNIIRVISETGLRVYKELMPMKKDQVDLENAMVWIPVEDAERDRGDAGRWRRSGSRSGSRDVAHGCSRTRPDLRSALHLRDALKRGWSRGRMGHRTPSAR